MLEGYQQIYDEVLFLDLLELGVLKEGFYYLLGDLLVAEDISACATEHYPADRPAYCVSYLELLIEEERLESSVGLFAHLRQSFVVRKQQSQQKGGFPPDRDDLAVTEGGG